MISAVVNQHFESGDACVSDYVAVYDNPAIANKSISYTCSKCGNTYGKIYAETSPAHHVKITQIIMIIVTTHSLKQNQNTLHKDH